MQTYFSILPERNGAANYESFNSMLDVAMDAGLHGYRRISTGYTRVDECRNGIVRTFLASAQSPDDLLIMLDADHRYPVDILTALSDHDPAMGVIGALAYRRGAPYEPLFFFRGIDGGLHAPVEFERGPVYQCAMISTSSIAIRRSVFDQLAEQGYPAPYFRYEYDLINGSYPSEDVYLSKVCELAGIPVYCDTGIEIPHATIGWITHETFESSQAANPTPSQSVAVNAKVSNDANS